MDENNRPLNELQATSQENLLLAGINITSKEQSSVPQDVEVIYTQLVDDSGDNIESSAVTIVNIQPKKIVKSKNRFRRFNNWVPDKYKPYIVFVTLGLFNFAYMINPSLIAKFGSQGGLDLYFFSFLRIVIPTILYCITAYIIEGPYKIKLNFKDLLFIGFFGLVQQGLNPFIGNVIGIKIDTVLLIVYLQLLPIATTIGSYALILEPLPRKNSIGSILLIIGILLTFGTSIGIVSINFTRGVTIHVTTSVWVYSGILALLTLIFYSISINYQIVKYTNNKDSSLYGKPITLTALSSIYASVLLVPGFGITSIIRREYVYPSLVSGGSWISMMSVVVIGGYMNSVFLVICNMLTSPLFVSNNNTIQLVYGFVWQYIILKEIMLLSQYILCGFMLASIILVVFAKYLIQKNK